MFLTPSCEQAICHSTINEYSKLYVTLNELLIHSHIHTTTRMVQRNTGLLISPQPDLLPNVFCLMVRIFRLMLVLFYMYK